MLFTKIQLQSLLDYREEYFKWKILPYTGTADKLCNDVKPSEQVVNITSVDCPMWNFVKRNRAVSEDMSFKDYTILQVYIAQRQGQIPPLTPRCVCVCVCVCVCRGGGGRWGGRRGWGKRTKFWLYLKRLASYIVSCNHKSLAQFWENNSWIFPPYKCIDAQTWLCCKKVRDQPRILIWTNLIDV